MNLAQAVDYEGHPSVKPQSTRPVRLRHGSRGTTVAILRLLLRKKSMTSAKIADAIHAPQPHVNTTLSQLRGNKFVEKHGDGQPYEWSITARGTAALREFDEREA